MKTLQKIIDKYSQAEYNSDNYHIGGGLDNAKFASRRHEDALSDKGKLTLGKANQMFAKATGLSVEQVKEVFEYAVPNMEWHHAGMLPKQYGGGMKKTYFLNSKEIVYVATNWNDLCEKLAISKEADRKSAEKERSREQKQHEFLLLNAVKVVRVSQKPEYFYETDREMNGKYGWFSSYGKSYNMPEYYTGWKFETKELLEDFYKI
jgi:hypothetical protein